MNQMNMNVTVNFHGTDSSISENEGVEAIARGVAMLQRKYNCLSAGIDAQAKGFNVHIDCKQGNDKAGHHKEDPAEEYQYPNAKRFHNIAELAAKIADHIENNNGSLPYDENMLDLRMLSKLIDFMQDRGFLLLQSTKVVQGLSVSELMRVSTGRCSRL